MILPKISLILLTLFFYSESSGQFNSSINNNKYEWHNKKECFDNTSPLEIFKVIETSPVLIGINQNRFESELKEIIRTNFINSDKEMEFNIQIFTLINQGVCVGGMLVKDGTAENFSNPIYEYISTFKNIEPGKQRGIEKNCLSEIYIRTKRNKLKELRFSNVAFRK